MLRFMWFLIPILVSDEEQECAADKDNDLYTQKWSAKS